LLLGLGLGDPVLRDEVLVLGPELAADLLLPLRVLLRGLLELAELGEESVDGLFPLFLREFLLLRNLRLGGLVLVVLHLGDGLLGLGVLRAHGTLLEEYVVVGG